MRLVTFSILTTLLSTFAVMAATDNKDAALALVKEAFDCRTGVNRNSTTTSADDISWRGDLKKFAIFFQRTVSDSASHSSTYEFRGGTYTSFYSLLNFKSEGSRLTVTCNKPACLAHSFIESGCDENGTCANISINSTRKEYVDSFYVDLCDSSAAKDAADGLTFVSGSN
jgi:hypothetical protein